MNKSIKVLIATHNRHKVNEFFNIVKSLELGINIEVLGALDVNLDMSEVEETGSTLAENALIKARYAYKETGLLSISDDSGFFIKNLPDILGVYSARFMGEYTPSELKIEAILNRLKEEGFTSESDRSATMSTSIAIVGRNFEDTFVRHCQGNVPSLPLGNEGFSFDRMFIPEGEVETFAQMGLSRKEQYSARKAALTAAMATIKFSIE